MTGPRNAIPAQVGPAAGRRCNICEATFTRQDHLARHHKIHTSEKPFKCILCGKTFARQDVLNRHFLSHEKDGSTSGNNLHARACKQCAGSRARCSRTEPCKRCSMRSLTCSYPSTRRAKRSNVANAPETDGHNQVVDMVAPVRGLSAEGEGGLRPLNTGGGTPSEEPGAHQPQAPNAWTERPVTFEESRLMEPTMLNANRVFDSEYVDVLNGQPIDLLSMNWMSPEFSENLAWNESTFTLPCGSTNRNGLQAPFAFPNSAHVPESGYGWPPVGVGHRIDHSVDPQLASVNSGSNSPHDADHDTSTYEPGANESEELQPGKGSCYIDGDGSRAPFRGRAIQRLRRKKTRPTGSSSTSGCYSVNHRQTDSINHLNEDLINIDNYNNMLHQLHLEINKSGINLHPKSIPTLQCAADCVQSYFDNFYPVFPFIQRSPFLEKSRKQWILLLAVIVMGSKYAPSGRREKLSDDFIQILDTVSRKRLHGFQEVESDISLGVDLQDYSSGTLDLPTLQAVTLNFILQTHTGKHRPLRLSLLQIHFLVGACNELGLLPPGRVLKGSDTDHNAIVRDWSLRQSQSRTGLMIWLLDAMLAYENNTSPLMQLVDAKVPLPCREDLWESPSVERVLSENVHSVTLLNAIESLYIEKEIPDNLSEFGAILLIHGIWRRTKEVMNQNQTQLANWVPTADVRPRIAQHDVIGEIWPPSSTILSKWRNSACDCLDVLHWRANAKAVSAGGLEYPSILFLHLSRLILLTPVVHIQTLAATPISSTQTADPACSEARNHVLRWALHDSFKARLSVIHAGALFWHVRRYSRGHFAEPFSIFIASLVIWAYSVSVQFAKQQGENQSEISPVDAPTREEHAPSEPSPNGIQPLDSSSDTDMEISFLYIDRPCDDEMVQMYLRLGYKMSAHMARVGIITDASAPGKIIREGIRLLTGCDPTDMKVIEADGGCLDGLGSYRWGNENSYIQILVRLASAIEANITNQRTC